MKILIINKFFPDILKQCPLILLHLSFIILLIVLQLHFCWFCCVCVRVRAGACMCACYLPPLSSPLHGFLLIFPLHHS